jgi:hypothetical protein
MTIMFSRAVEKALCTALEACGCAAWMIGTGVLLAAGTWVWLVTR